MVTEPDQWADRFSVDQAVVVDGTRSEPIDRAPIGVAALVLGGFAIAGMAVLSFVGALDGSTNGPEALAIEDSAAVAEEPGESSDAATGLDDTTVASSEAPATTVVETTEEVATTVAPTTAAPTTTTVPEAQPEPANLARAEDLLDAPRSAVFSGGVVYLQGAVPSQEVAAEIIARVGAVVGPDNVVADYEIDPEADAFTQAPLFVEDTVLFEIESAEINRAFIPLLQLGTTLMQQVPTVEVTVIAHTDSTGDETFNQLLSERRAAAVKAFWVESGIDPSRIETIGLGESTPVVANSGAVGRSTNRRAEFIIHGILGPVQ